MIGRALHRILWAGVFLLLVGCAAPTTEQVADEPVSPPAGATTDPAAHVHSATGGPSVLAAGETPLSASEMDTLFRFEVRTNPSRPVAGSVTEFDVYITDPGGRRIPGLRKHYNRIANFLLISENLEEFHHLHPEDFWLLTPEAFAEGRFSFPVTFQRGGQYALLVDFIWNGRLVAKEFPIRVDGPDQERTGWNFSRTRSVEGMTLQLHTNALEIQAPGRIEANIAVEIGGAPAEDLQPYLGALAHLVVAREGAESLVHTHGGGQEYAHAHAVQIVAGYSGPKIYFGHRFERAGRYRIFVQMKHQGRVYLETFDLQVAERNLGLN